MTNKRGGPNKRIEWTNLYVYYIKNNGEGRQIFSLLHEKNKEYAISVIF